MIEENRLDALVDLVRHGGHRLPLTEIDSFGDWLAGLTDGEGCFRIHTEKGGLYFACHFQVKLRRDDTPILLEIAAFFGVGRFSYPQGTGAAKPLTMFVVDTRAGCIVVRDIFRRYRLRAKKSNDFIVWSEALDAWQEQVRGNRWHGPGDRSKMRGLWSKMKKVREYVEPREGVVV